GAGAPSGLARRVAYDHQRRAGGRTRQSAERSAQLADPAPTQASGSGTPVNECVIISGRKEFARAPEPADAASLNRAEGTRGGRGEERAEDVVDEETREERQAAAGPVPGRPARPAAGNPGDGRPGGGRPG